MIDHANYLLSWHVVYRGSAILWSIMPTFFMHDRYRGCAIFQSRFKHIAPNLQAAVVVLVLWHISLRLFAYTYIRIFGWLEQQWNSSSAKYLRVRTTLLFNFKICFKSSGGWIKIKLKLPHFHIMFARPFISSADSAWFRTFLAVPGTICSAYHSVIFLVFKE